MGVRCVNKLQGWTQRQGFGLAHETLFEDQHLPEKDRIHPAKWGKG